MLLLRKKTATIKNITFFADDSDENQFWYLPEDIHLAERDGKPVFSLIKYTGDGSGQQGGYLNFEVNTLVTDAELKAPFEEYLRKLGVSPKNARLAQVPYDNGTVNFFVLDAKNANGELISAQSPSLFASNSAIFSAKLSPEQTVILESAFNKAQAPAAVAYNLSYTGITPALKVEVEATFENVYTEFEAKFGANIPIPVETPASFWLGFDSVIKKLEQDQKLIIKVTESMPGEEAAKEKEWALDFVKEEILKSFFHAELKPNEDNNAQAKSTSASILEALFASAAEKDGGEGEDKGKGGLLPCASLDLKLVRQQEAKRLNFNYTSSKALSQSAVPQNFIGSKLLRAAKQPPYFIEVNVNDPFFQQVELTVLGPDGFDEYGLKAAAVSISYNNSNYSVPAFTKEDGEWQKTISRSRNLNEPFNYQGSFTFKSAASSGWEGSSSYPFSNNQSTALINLAPGDLLTFNEIEILTDGSFDWDKYNQVIVEVNYVDENQRKKTKKYTFSHSKSDSQYFKYRCLTDSPWKVGHTITYFLVGGASKVVTGEENQPAIIIQNVE